MVEVARNRRPLYGLYLATAISAVGSMLTLVALLWFVLQTTGSAARTGIVSAVLIVPVLAASVLGGPLVDRLGHKRASVAADIISGLAIGLIPLIHHTVGLPYGVLLVLVAIRGLADAPGRVARRSLVPELAGRAAIPLERANAVTQMIVNGALLVGPAVSGVLISVLGASNVLWIDAATYGIAASIVTLLIPRTLGVREVNEASDSYISELVNGFRYLRGEPAIVMLLFMSTAMHVINEPLYQVVLPVYANRVLDSAVDYGFLIAGYGAGSLVAALVYGVVGHLFSCKWLMYGAIALASAPYWILIALPGRWIALVAIVIAGLAASPVALIQTTFIQERVPAPMRGRVFGLTTMTIAAMPLGITLAGVIIDAAGLRATLAVQGIASVILLIVLTLLPMGRELDRSKEEAQQATNLEVPQP